MATNKKGQPSKKTTSIGKTASKKPMVKTSAKKTANKASTKTLKSVSKSVAKKAIKKAVHSKNTAVKKTAVKKMVKPVAKNIAAKSSTKKVSVKKEQVVSKISKKVLPKKSVNVSKNNIANVESNLKKDKKNVTKDLAKTKKVSKIDTLSADHNNKNKTMQKKITETLPTKKSEHKTHTADTKKDTKNIVSKPIASNVVEKESKQDKSEVPKVSIKPSISADNVLLEVVDPGFLTNDDVFDEADHAQWQQLREQADIQSRAMQLNRPETHPDFNGSECVECGIEIPLARLKMHKVRCVDCQNELEQERARTQRSTYTSKSSTNGWDD